MGDAGLAGQLVRAAYPYPHLQGGDRRCVVLLDEDRETVGQAMTHEHLATNRSVRSASASRQDRSRE
jgi:hypothetical protein